VREVTLGAYSHQDVPLAKLVGELQVKRDVSHNPLFQVVCLLQNASTQTLELPGLRLSPFEFQVTTAPFDMIFSLSEHGDSLRGMLTYNTALFDEQTMRRLFSDYEKVLERVVADPNQPLSSLQVLARAVSSST
jgi:non-ribosomal peptide synthetase component F